MTLRDITDSTEILIDGAARPITLGDFLRLNADAIDGGDLDVDALRSDLAERSVHEGGGGAAATFVVRLA